VLDAALAARLRRLITGSTDPILKLALERRSNSPAVEAYALLVDRRALPATAELSCLQAGIEDDFSAEVLAAAALDLNPCARSASSETCQIAIDEPDTCDVDDAVSVARDGGYLRVDVDVINVAAYFDAGTVLDDAAASRVATLYLPSRTLHMLPEVLSCDRASLAVGALRPCIRTSIWFDDDAVLKRYEIRPVEARLKQRLSYGEADAAIARPTRDARSPQLQSLVDLTHKLNASRRKQGSFSFQKKEWKIRVTDQGRSIAIVPVDYSSASRSLVAELMILVNRLAAEFALQQDLPLIFRRQAAPTSPLPTLAPDDPVAFSRMRGLIAPAVLSAEPGAHFALGLSAYAQLTSPLRRYCDLVCQRQLYAHLRGQRPPHTREHLSTLAAALARREAELKRVEGSVAQRWSLEHLARAQRNAVFLGHVIGNVNGGPKVQLAACGAIGLLSGSGALPLGTAVSTRIQRVDPLRGRLRLRPLSL
jgi:exoribonuclease-2